MSGAPRALSISLQVWIAGITRRCRSADDFLLPPLDDRSKGFPDLSISPDLVRPTHERPSSKSASDFNRGDRKMKFLSLYKPARRDGPPSPEYMADMGKLIEESMKSGVLLAT